MVDKSPPLARVVQLLLDTGEPFIDSDDTNVQSGKNIYRVVINSGSKNGVKSGSRYLIFTKGDEIVDATTGENLGCLEIVRGNGIVVHVQENISIVRSSESTKVQKRDMYSPIATVLVDEDRPFYKAAVGDFARPI